MQEPSSGCWAKATPYVLKPKTRNQKIAFAVFWTVLIGGIACLFIWSFPKFVDEVIVPATKQIQKKLSKFEVCVILAAAAIFLPLVFVTYGPFVWVGAIILGFWLCLVILLVATTFGMWLAYELGRRLLRSRVERWIQKRPNIREVMAAIDRVGPFRLQLLLRLGPVPSHFLNYASGVPPSMTPLPYISASALGMLPYHVMLVYFGKNIKGIAALMRGESMPLAQLLYNAMGILVSFVFLVAGYMYAQKTLRKIREEQQLREAEQEIAAAAAAAATVEVEAGPRSASAMNPLLAPRIPSARSASVHALPPPLMETSFRLDTSPSIEMAAGGGGGLGVEFSRFAHVQQGGVEQRAVLPAVPDVARDLVGGETGSKAGGR